MTRQHPGSSGPVPSAPVSPGRIKSVCLAHSELHQTGEQACPHACRRAWLSLVCPHLGSRWTSGRRGRVGSGPGGLLDTVLFLSSPGLDSMSQNLEPLLKMQGWDWA